MKTIFSRLILALAFLLAASATSAEETDLKELRYTYENHLTTNDSISEYLFHLEYPMIMTVNHAGSPADSTLLRLWKKAEGETEYTLVTEAHDYSRASGTAHLWNRIGASGKVRGDTLAMRNAQAFLCRSLPAGHYKLTSLRKGERASTGCLPELKTNIYAQAESASQTDPVKVLLNRSGVSCWNAPYQGKRILYYQLSVECNMTIDIEAHETGNSTLILEDEKGVMIAQSAESKITQQALTPGKYTVNVPVEDGYCKANIRFCEGGEGLDGALVLDGFIRPEPDPEPEPTPDPEPKPEPEPEPKPEPEIPEQPESYTPSATRNYIQTIVPTIGSDSVANFSYLSKARHQIRYYDYLGRPVQEIEYKASPVRKDLITYREYDGQGRDSRQWLPTERAESTSGVWMTPEDFISNAGKLYGDSYACHSTVYDGSSLNLIKEEYGPGEAWQTSGHGIKHDYRVNTSDDHCLWLSSGGARELHRQARASHSQPEHRRQ